MLHSVALLTVGSLLTARPRPPGCPTSSSSLPTIRATRTSAASAAPDHEHAQPRPHGEPRGWEFTDFYVAQAVCSASRAALLTGCYPEPRRHSRGAGAGQRRSASATSGDDARRAGPTTRLRHGHLRQVAPRPPAASSCRRGTASTSTSACPTRTTCGRITTANRNFPPLPLIEGEKIVNPNVTARPDAADHLVHRARGAVHREEQGPAVLPLPAAHHAARAAVRLRQVQGQDPSAASYGDVIRRSTGPSARSSPR